MLPWLYLRVCIASLVIPQGVYSLPGSCQEVGYASLVHARRWGMPPRYGGRREATRVWWEEGEYPALRVDVTLGIIDSRPEYRTLGTPRSSPLPATVPAPSSVPADKALGSVRRKTMGGRLSSPSGPQECDRWWEGLRRVTPLFPDERTRRSDRRRVNQGVGPCAGHVAQSGEYS